MKGLPSLPPPRVTREHIDGLAILNNIREMVFHLAIGHRPVYLAPAPGTSSQEALRHDPPQAPIWEPIADEDLKRYTLLIGTQLKLLNKVMPELRAVEYTDSTPQRSLSDLEVAQKLTAILDAAQGRSEEVKKLRSEEVKKGRSEEGRGLAGSPAPRLVN